MVDLTREDIQSIVRNARKARDVAMGEIIVAAFRGVAAAARRLGHWLLPAPGTPRRLGW